MAVYGYVRVSSDHQAKSGLSLDEQRSMIDGYAVAKGMGSVAEIYVDSGVSGGVELERRAQGARLLATLVSGDIVIATRLDRVFRRASDALVTVDLFKKRGISLHLIDIGNVSGNGVSALFLTILAGVSEFEKSLISERQIEAKRRLKSKGRFLGGDRKTGFDVEITADQSGKQVKLLRENATEQKAIDFIRHNMGSLSLASLADQIKQRFSLDWNRMRISRIRKRVLNYQSASKQSRWRGEKSVDFKERQVIQQSAHFSARRKKRLGKARSKKSTSKR